MKRRRSDILRAARSAATDLRMARKKSGHLAPKLTESEQDLLSHLQEGYELETDSLGGNLVLRSRKKGEVLRPADANASTVKALQQRGLIRPGKGRDALTIAWRLLREK